MNVQHVADAVVHMAKPAARRQHPVHDGDGDQHAVCRAGIGARSAWRPSLRQPRIFQNWRFFPKAISVNPSNYSIFAIRSEILSPALPRPPYHRPTAAQRKRRTMPADGGQQRRSVRGHGPLVGMCGRLTEGSPVRHGLSPSCVEVRRDNGRGRHPRGPSRTVCLRSPDGTSNLRAGRRGPHTVAKPRREPQTPPLARRHPVAMQTGV